MAQRAPNSRASNPGPSRVAPPNPSEPLRRPMPPARDAYLLPFRIVLDSRDQNERSIAPQRYISKISFRPDVLSWTDDPNNALLCIPTPPESHTGLSSLQLLVSSATSQLFTYPVLKHPQNYSLRRIAPRALVLGIALPASQYGAITEL